MRNEFDDKANDPEGGIADPRASASDVEPAPAGKTPAVADDVLPDSLYLIPVPQRPFFPGQVQPVAMNLDEWGGTLKAVMEGANGLVEIATATTSRPTPWPCFRQ